MLRTLFIVAAVAAVAACNQSSAVRGDAGVLDMDASVETAPEPVATDPALLVPGTGLYPRVIRTTSGVIVASVVTLAGGTILKSIDDGMSFSVIGHINNDPAAATGLCCATLYELPQAVGTLAAGTLLWAASIGGPTPSQPMKIIAWSSSDGGQTWNLLPTIATAGVVRSRGGLWEPEFSQLADGTLVCHYSDETDPAHSQKLVEVRTTDAVTWSGPSSTIALASFGSRPGMANVRRMPSGSYMMSYEICGVAGDNCTAHLRTSTDGWNWGNANDPGLRPVTLDGKHFAHAPTLAWSPTPGANGRLYMIGQLVLDSAGNVAPENGKAILANTEGGVQRWYEIAAPVPVPAAYDNFCPNYSSPLLPLDDGRFGLEIASRWDGATCQAYFARGALLGTGDTTGAELAVPHRLVNVMSGLCLDVTGGSTAGGTAIEQWTCNGLSPQTWTVATTTDGHITLRAKNSGMCMTSASTPGSGIVQQPCDDSAAQAWTLRNLGLGYYRLGHAGSCLDDTGGSVTAGTPMQLWSCNDLSPQIWHLEAP
ncbi:hypothetical protein BH11MYX1_BH11MYX1_01840 [soil metagenome]